MSQKRRTVSVNSFEGKREQLSRGDWITRQSLPQKKKTGERKEEGRKQKRKRKKTEEIRTERTARPRFSRGRKVAVGGKKCRSRSAKQHFLPLFSNWVYEIHRRISGPVGLRKRGNYPRQRGYEITGPDSSWARIKILLNLRRLHVRKDNGNVSIMGCEFPCGSPIILAEF